MDSVNKKVVESRRRITNIHADLNHEMGQMNQEVSQMNATNAMKQRTDEFTRLATPTNQYEFKSRGLSNRESLSDKVLSWEATFDRRIEHFVYPSLQTLDEPDIELFDEKEEEKAMLHGHYGHVGERSMNAQRRRSSVIDTNKLSTRTPSLVNKLTTKKNITYANSPKYERQKKEDSVTQMIDEEKPIDYTIFVEKPLKWTVKTEELPTSARRKFEEKNTFNELLRNADKYMKEKMRADYELRLVNKVNERKENKRLGLNNTDDKVQGTSKHSEHRRRRAGMIKRRHDPHYSDKAHMFLSGDQLYDSLKEEGRQRRDRISKSLLVEGSDASLYKTQEEVVRDVQRDLKALPEVEMASTVKGGMDHLYDGLLYYQVKNQFNIHQQTKATSKEAEEGEYAMEEELGFGSPHATTRTTVHTSKSMLPTTTVPASPLFSSPHSTKPSTPLARDSRSREGLQNRMKSLEVGSEYHDTSPVLRSSVRRALSSMYLGYDKVEIYRAQNTLTDELEHDIVELRLQQRATQDTLLYDQLKSGILPENLFRRGNTLEKMFILDLNFYNLGDEMGVCLGNCLKSYQSLTCIKLRECRLTSRSLPIIVHAFSRQCLRELDLSYNDLHGEASRALSDFFMEEPTVLETLWLARGQMKCSDIDVIMKGLIMHSSDDFKGVHSHMLKTLHLDNNSIKSTGTEAISFYLKGEGCKLTYLNMEWNQIGIVGAERMASALKHLKQGEKNFKMHFGIFEFVLQWFGRCGGPINLFCNSI